MNRYRQNSEFATIERPHSRTENPYRNIVFFTHLEKFGVTVSKNPFVKVASLHDTLDEAIAARTELRKDIEAKRNEKAAAFTFAQNSSPLTPDPSGFFDYDNIARNGFDSP